MRLIGALIAAVPFAFAMIRLLATGSDTRYLSMAIASALCSTAVLVGPSSPASPSRVRAAVATIAAATGAAMIAVVRGATAGSGIAIVAMCFGFFTAFGMWLLVRSRVRRSS